MPVKPWGMFSTTSSIRPEPPEPSPQRIHSYNNTYLQYYCQLSRIKYFSFTPHHGPQPTNSRRELIRPLQTLQTEEVLPQAHRCRRPRLRLTYPFISTSSKIHDRRRAHLSSGSLHGIPGTKVRRGSLVSRRNTSPAKGCFATKRRHRIHQQPCIGVS